MAPDNVETTRRAVARFNDRDFDGALVDAAEDLTWEPFIARAETPLLRGKDEVRASWASQVELIDVHVEPREVFSVTSDTVVAVVEVSGHGSSSEMHLSTVIAWLCSFDAEGVLRSIASYASKEEALAATGAA